MASWRHPQSGTESAVVADEVDVEVGWRDGRAMHQLRAETTFACLLPSRA